MPKKSWFIGVLLIVLLASGGGFVYTYNTGALSIGIAEPSGDIATVTEATSQPDWNSLISENATISGDVPLGNLYLISPQAGYGGDLVVKAYLANTSALIKAYRYLNIKLYLENSEEASETPDYRLLTLENGVATFSLEAGGGGPSPTSWTETTQADFEAGTLTDLDTTSSPGDVKLAAGTTTLAWDDFESGGWSGGSGWLYPWWHEGKSKVTGNGGPYQGNYHLRIRGGNGYVDRALDLSGQTDVRLQFWAKVKSLESGDLARVLVSPDDTNWTTVQSWTDGDDDNTYHFYDIDLSGFTMSGEFWIAFDGTELSGSGDYLYVDEIKLVSGLTQYRTAGSLISQPHDTGGSADFGTLAFTITEPADTDIKFQLRSAATSGGLASADWYGPTGSGDYYTTSGTAINPVHDNDRWIQYQAVFSGDGSDTPTLSDVTITYTVSDGNGLADSMLSVVGGSYRKVSNDTSDWAAGWSIIPEIYVEVMQR